MNRKGFTLIELILVITILGILAISALPSFWIFQPRRNRLRCRVLSVRSARG